MALPAQGGGGMGGVNAPNSPSTGGGTYYAPPSGAVAGAEDYAGAQDAYNRALTRFNSQRTGLLRQYGYGGTIDPTSGMLTNLHVDTGSTYGGLQQLLHNQANEDQQAEYSAEDRGLSGGLAHQGEGELRYQHAGQSSALANEMLGGFSDLNNQQLDAKSTLDQALWQLAHSATTDATSAGDYNPADLSGDAGGAGPPAGSAGPRGAARVGTPAQIAAASMAAKTAAARAGKATPAQALAARSAGMNAAYNLVSKAAAKKAPANAYLTNSKKKG